MAKKTDSATIMRNEAVQIYMPQYLKLWVQERGGSSFVREIVRREMQREVATGKSSLIAFDQALDLAHKAIYERGARRPIYSSKMTMSNYETILKGLGLLLIYLMAEPPSKQRARDLAALRATIDKIRTRKALMEQFIVQARQNRLAVLARYHQRDAT